MEKPKKKRTRYMSGYVSYKTVPCRMTEYEDMLLTDYCLRNNISKSLLLNSAAMYCIKNNISADDLLSCSVNGSNSDYRELIDDDEKI